MTTHDQQHPQVDTTGTYDAPPSQPPASNPEAERLVQSPDATTGSPTVGTGPEFSSAETGEQSSYARGPSDETGGGSVPFEASTPTSGAIDVAEPNVESTAGAEHTGSSSRESLFVDGELSGLRLRWDEVQAGFVDDPKACVQRADGLVSDVVDRLTSGFSDARSRLEEQWARGEQASTEDLRVALKRYREFFERLLSV